jgi:hypothetical protein
MFSSTRYYVTVFKKIPILYKNNLYTLYIRQILWCYWINNWHRLYTIIVLGVCRLICWLNQCCSYQLIAYEGANPCHWSCSYIGISCSKSFSMPFLSEINCQVFYLKLICKCVVKYGSAQGTCETFFIINTWPFHLSPRGRLLSSRGQHLTFYFL